MDSENRESGGRNGEPGRPPRDSAVPGTSPPVPDEPARPSKQDDFSMLMSRHRKTLDLLAK